MAESETIHKVTDDNFDEAVKTGVSLVDFYADWCAPCRMLTPVIESVSKEMQGMVKFLKLDIDSNQKTATNYQVTSVPTLILFKDGKEINRLVGLRDEGAVKQFISSALQ